MKKILKISLSLTAAAVVAVVAALLYGRFSFMSELRVENHDNAIGPLPMSLLNLGMLGPDMPFRIDMGSSVNTISHDYLAKLKRRGCKVDSMPMLMYVRTAVGGHRLTTRRYRVSLPVYSYDIDVVGGKIVSSIDTTNVINGLENVDFVLTMSADEVPRLGRPFFRKFLMEYDHDIRAVRFHTEMPEGYEEIKGLSTDFSVLSDPAIYLTLRINGEEHDFFLNSSMPRAGILMPAKEAPAIDNRNVYADCIQSVYGSYPAVIDYDVWVEWNDRAGRNVGYYSDYGVHPYALNPFNFLTQDAVFDFANAKVYLRPYSDRDRRLRVNDAFAQR